MPFGEIVLIFSLLTINYSKLIPRLSSIVFLLPFVLWWFFGLSWAVISALSHGMWAFRDATHVIESLFLIVGFAFAANPKNIERFFRFLSILFVIAAVYSFTYPFRETLRTLSPTIQGGTGRVVPILFNYQTSAVMLFMAVSYILIAKRNVIVLLMPSFVPALFLLVFTVIMFQARTIYLQVIALAIFFMLYRKKIIEQWIIYLVFLFMMLALMPIIDLEISGRLGQKASLDFFTKHFASMFGIEDEGVVGAARGVGQRFGWWMILYDRWTATATSFLFGLGYGLPLIDFHGGSGQVVREPHNSAISILARLGLVGGVSFVWMHILLLRVWNASYKLCLRAKWKKGQNWFLIFMVYFILIWVYSIGEDAFEKPYNTIPYYFFWGIVLRFAKHLKDGSIGPDITSHARSASP